MSVKFDVTKRIEWLKKRMTITELDEEYIRLQIMEAMMEALEKGQSLPIDSVMHCSMCDSTNLEDCGGGEYSCEDCGHFPITA